MEKTPIDMRPSMMRDTVVITATPDEAAYLRSKIYTDHTVLAEALRTSEEKARTTDLPTFVMIRIMPE